MIARTVELTLEKAKEWYNSGSADLKEIALQAYTKEELETPKWANIKTFEDACRALDLDYDNVVADLHNIERLRLELGLTEHIQAVYKLDIIRKALNGGWVPDFTKGAVYYPIVKFYPADIAKRLMPSDSLLKFSKSFMTGDQTYTLIGSNASQSSYGQSIFIHGDGDVTFNLSLLGCKSREIAKHMANYFLKEIFEAAYAQHVGTYQWV